MMTVQRVIVAMVLATLLAGVASAREPAAKPAILLLGQDAANWALPQKLSKDYGFVVAACGFDELTGKKLSQFNAVILFDMSRLSERSRAVNSIEISPEGFRRVSDLLYRYVREGGGLYVYGMSYNHMGAGWPTDTLNKFLQRLGAQVLFETLRDGAREERQTDGLPKWQSSYALADSIAPHPATSGVRHYWYVVGTWYYGPLTRPLALSSDWTALVRSSPGFKSTPFPDTFWADGPPTPAVSGVKEKTAVIYAARQYGRGRIVLNGGESTISFFGYGYSPYADRVWGRIGMEAGLKGIKSDGLQLFVASLRWLVQPSQGNFGGYIPPVKPPFQPKVAAPIQWDRPAGVGGDLPYKRGVLGAQPAVGGGSGSIAQWVGAAKAQRLAYVVFAGDFAKMDQAAWDRMCAECKAASTADFLAMPALLTRDNQNNTFLQCGPQSWPKTSRLSKKRPKRVEDHVGYWMSDCNFPCRVICLFSQGQYPAWLYSCYDTFAVRTYQDGKLVDEAVNGFLQNQEQGDRSRIVVLDLLSSPSKLAQVKEYTYVAAGTAAELEETFTQQQFAGGAISYVSSGPQIRNWYVSNARRETYGEFYKPGTERWRASLRVTSDVPLKSVTIYDSTRVFRRMALSGKTAEVNVEGLHDMRHILAALVEDEQGNKAMTGSIEIQDALMYQDFCGDRGNIMSGDSMIREADGRDLHVPASSVLYKAGRLFFGTVALCEGLPGVDGSGGATEFTVWPNLNVEAADPAKTENRLPLHRIERPWEAADGLVFDTPILKRCASPGAVEIFGHAPYVDLGEPRIGARLVQWHFYRKPVYPSTVMAEMSTTIADPAGVKLKQGGNGFTQQWASAWSGEMFKYLVLRADGTHEEGPSADEKVTNWRGRLQPGDCVIFPEFSEGMYVLDGLVDVIIESRPSEKWFRMYLGRFDTPTLLHGAKTSARVMNVKFRGGLAHDPIAEFTRFRDQYGIAGRPPAYSLVSTQGKATAQRYLLELAADQNGWAGTIGKADLPQRLPLRVAGINPKWTAAKVDLVKNEWYPLGVWQGAACTTVDTKEGDQKLYVGNLVTADNPDVWLTLLPSNADGKTYVEVHNPTEADLPVTLRVPVATFLAKKQEIAILAPKLSSIWVELKP